MPSPFGESGVKIEVIERLILAYARSEEELNKFIEFLRKHYPSVMAGPVQYNNRDPFEGGVRAYITVVGEADE